MANSDMVTIPKSEYDTLKILVTAMMYDRDPKEFIFTMKNRLAMASCICVGVQKEWCGVDGLDEKFYLTGPDGKKF